MNGEFIPWEEANIPVMSHGLHYGTAVFEGERAYNGQIFKSIEHAERFHRSAQMVDMQIPYSVEEIMQAKQAIVAKNGLKNAYIRPIAWRGPETISVASKSCSVHVAIAAWQMDSYFNADGIFEKGIRLAWADWRRPAPDTAPTAAKASGSYIIGSMAKNKAERQGFHDALMLDHRGYIAECTGANFFMVKNGIIHTPIADCFLDGITRRTVIEMAREHNIRVIERRIKPEEIATADEIFITGTAVEIAPVGQIGGYTYQVGPITRFIAEQYGKMVRIAETTAIAA
jgi:2-isopropylmalate synthase